MFSYKKGEGNWRIILVTILLFFLAALLVYIIPKTIKSLAHVE